jgi:hypothetical protein
MTVCIPTNTDGSGALARSHVTNLTGTDRNQFIMPKVTGIAVHSGNLINITGMWIAVSREITMSAK